MNRIEIVLNHNRNNYEHNKNNTELNYDDYDSSTKNDVFISDSNDGKNLHNLKVQDSVSISLSIRSLYNV